jgi:hypothetical protein
LNSLVTIQIASRILMLCLFWRKIFYEKCFLYFSVLGAIENNSQAENIFQFDQKIFYSFEKWFTFLSFVIYFLSLSISLSNRWTITNLAPDHYRTTPDHQRAILKPPLSHSQTTTEPPWTTMELLPNPQATLGPPPSHPRTTTEPPKPPSSYLRTITERNDIINYIVLK